MKEIMISDNFTDEDKQKINDTLEKIVNDIYDIYNYANLNEITVLINLKLPNGEKYKYLYINEDTIALYKNIKGEDSSCLIFKHGKIHFSMIESDYAGDLEFINKYPKYRQKIIKSSKVVLESRESKMHKLNSVSNFLLEKQKEQKLREGAIILDMPDVMNRPKIVMQKENGRTIGTIDFGSRTIKVITDGEIVLVNKDQIEEVNNKNRVKTKAKD